MFHVVFCLAVRNAQVIEGSEGVLRGVETFWNLRTRKRSLRACGYPQEPSLPVVEYCYAQPSETWGPLPKVPEREAQSLGTEVTSGDK